MTNSMDALKASQMTPQAIKESTQTPEEIFMILRSAATDPKEKLKALVQRSDITGSAAQQLLKKVFERHTHHGQINFFQATMLNLYISKFVKRGKQCDSIHYVVMMLLVWIDFMDSILDKVKPTDVKAVLPQLRVMVLSLVKRYQPYQLSATTLLDDIEASCLNCDKVFPSEYRSILADLTDRVFPYIGEILIDLALEGTYYDTPENLRVFATRKYFGNDERIAPAYIKSIEATFTLKDINPFAWIGTMEEFLLSEDGAIAQARFHTLCEDAPTEEVLTLLSNKVSYAGFHLAKNKAYKMLSLEAKADFLKPYSSRLESNYRAEQLGLLRLWITDTEWDNPDRSISELTHLALKKRHLFSFNGEWVFGEMMQRLVWIVYNKGIYDALVANKQFLTGLYYALISGQFIPDERYPEDFSPALVLIVLQRVEDKLKECADDKQKPSFFAETVFRETKERLTKVFIEHVGTCLKDYSTADACEMVQLARGWDSETVITLLMDRSDLTLQQTSDLLSGTKYDQYKKVLVPVVNILCAKLLEFIRATRSNDDCARTVLYLLAKHYYRLFDEAFVIFAVIFERKVFHNLAKLLPIVEEFLGQKEVTYKNLPEVYISKEFIDMVRIAIQRFINAENKNKEEALVFCQHPLFAENYSVWKWFYDSYPIQTLSDLQLSKLKEDSIVHIFSDSMEPKRREELRAVWVKTPFKEISPDFRKFLMGHRYLVTFAEHPEWKTISLKERLKFFTPDNKHEYGLLLESLEQDFDRLWKKGKWTVDRYLREIERINPPNPEAFAALAVSLV